MNSLLNMMKYRRTEHLLCDLLKRGVGVDEIGCSGRVSNSSVRNVNRRFSLVKTPMIMNGERKRIKQNKYIRGATEILRRLTKSRWRP